MGIVIIIITIIVIIIIIINTFVQCYSGVSSEAVSDLSHKYLPGIA